MEKERSAWADDAQKAFDKKDYESALDIWLDFAAEGDREAQFMCGEIYYKGPWHIGRSRKSSLLV